MEPFFITLMLAMPTPNPLMMPITGPYRDGNGQQIGTVTTWRNKMYVRGLDSEPIMTVVINADGSKTLFDPNGKVIDQLNR